MCRAHTSQCHVVVMRFSIAIDPCEFQLLHPGLNASGRQKGCSRDNYGLTRKSYSHSCSGCYAHTSDLSELFQKGTEPSQKNLPEHCCTPSPPVLFTCPPLVLPFLCTPMSPHLPVTPNCPPRPPYLSPPPVPLSPHFPIPLFSCCHAHLSPH